MALDITDSAFRENPYGTYARLRRDSPLHRGAAGAWVVTRHADVKLLLSDSRLSHWSSGAGSRFQQVIARWVRLMDPRNRAPLRAHVNRILSPGGLEAHRARIERLADRLLSQAESRGSMEVIRDLAQPLSVDVIGALLGVPEEEADHFRGLIDALEGRLFELLSGSAPSSQPFSDFAAYVRRLSERPHASAVEPDTLIPAMMAARTQGDTIVDDDVLSFALIFIFAGHDNMMNFIGNGTLALARHADAWESLAARSASVRAAVEELLRYDGPVQFVHLVVREPMTLHGRVLRSGDVMLASVASANRDPEVFDRPDVLDLARHPNPHLGFGTGALFCVGAALARLQGRVVFDALTRRFHPPTVLTTPVQWRATPDVLRGPVALALRVEARAEAGVPASA